MAGISMASEGKPIRLMVNRFNQFGGKHCETSALRKVLAHRGVDLSEEMLLGIGGGPGFFYMEIGQLNFPLIATRFRDTKRDFLQTICERIGGKAEIITGKIKGTDALIESLSKKEPAIVYGDMVFLDYLALPPEAHFGGHSFVVYGIDAEQDTVYISDRANTGVTARLRELEEARGSTFKPYPPNYKILDISYPSGKMDLRSVVMAGIRDCYNNMLYPPIKNIGLSGIQKWASLIVKWPDKYRDLNLWGALLNAFIFIETGGTGGQAFRNMYAKFLREAVEITGNRKLDEVARMMDESGSVWSNIAEAVLPDSCQTLAETKKLMVEKNRIFEQYPGNALERMQEINRKMDEAKHGLDKDLGKAPGFLLDVQRLILQVYDIEKRAFSALKAAVK